MQLNFAGLDSHKPLTKCIHIYLRHARLNICQKTWQAIHKWSYELLTIVSRMQVTHCESNYKHFVAILQLS
jgi:hypothetical protein